MRLVVAEKPLAARRIARILAGKTFERRMFRLPVIFSDYAVFVPLRGHIFDVDFPHEMNSWNYPLEKLIEAELRLVPRDPQAIKLLRYFAPQANDVIIATDYDREGELIGFEAASVIREVNPRVRIFRAIFSAITPEAIRKAFSELKEIDINLAMAARARMEIDLLWGAVLTRYLSLTFNSRGKDFLSAGRVQTPTLRLIVEREEEIQRFVPEEYYVIRVEIEQNGITVKGKVPGKWKSKEEAEAVKRRIRKTGIVKDVSEKEKVVKRPLPMNTTDLLAEAAKLGFSPEKTMRIAENLYMKGFISYPRTDNRSFRGVNIGTMISLLRNSPFAHLLTGISGIPREGKYTGDHPPIHPVGVPRNLTPEEWKIYELVVRHFIACVHRDAKILKLKAVIDAGVEIEREGTKILDPGWLNVFPQKIEICELPLKKGVPVQILKVSIKKEKTKPPSRYSISELVRTMEKLGLGTKSTRHEIVAKLKARKYITVGKTVKPTERAFKVINLLRKRAEVITSPKMTADLEKEMDLIAKGVKDKDSVVLESRKLLGRVLSELLRGDRN